MKSLLRVALALLSLFLLLGALLVLVLGVFNATEWWDQRRYPPTTQFVAHRWKSDRKYRYSVLQAVEKTIIKKGMARPQVKALLGNPDADEKGVWQESSDARQAGFWAYDTQRPGIDFMGFEGTLLRIEFDAKGKIKSVQKEDWTD